MAALLPHSEERHHMCDGWLKAQQGASEEVEARMSEALPEDQA